MPRIGSGRALGRDVPALAQPAPAALRADPPGGRPRQCVRQRAGDPVPVHLPAQRARHRPARHGTDRGHERGGRARRRAAGGNADRPDRRAPDARHLARPDGDRLRRVPVRARAVAGIPGRSRRRRRKRRFLAEPVQPHRRARPLGAAHLGVRDAARDDEPRNRARRAQRRPDRDHGRPGHVHRPVPPGRGHVPRLRRRPRLRPGAAAPRAQRPRSCRDLSRTCSGTASSSACSCSTSSSSPRAWRSSRPCPSTRRTRPVSARRRSAPSSSSTPS